ncbi:RNA-guided endonuclease InsQ/TnpB family protein [Natronorarus salvus]|uniref:RNA-guided endonuclease InsQ/TnpB family protein n=1 Tax=Natronorarus salvus TaxID=3117733 RepID=UPI002F25F563
MASDTPGEERTLASFQPETKTEDITRCIVIPLETSKRKNEYLRECIDEWQNVARTAAERLPSIRPNGWTRNNPQVGKIAKEYDRETISAALTQQAVYKATEAFDAWRELGYPGDRPIGRFGDGNYLRATNQQITIEENDHGYGAKLNFIPYNPIWFHLDTAGYHEKWLSRIVDPDDETRHGAGEVRLDDDGTAALHLTVVSKAEVVVAEDVERWLGVDLGESVIYATAIVGVHSGGVSGSGVEIESGREFRHYRERLKRKRDRLGSRGDLRGVRQCKGDIEKYTEQTLHTASRRIVELAADHAPCGIRLEDMGEYRETAHDPIHDWPRGMIADQIVYKATAAGVPVELVDPRDSSQTCRKCGQTDPAARVDRSTFHCRRCDYEVHADVNAAINIARGGVRSSSSSPSSSEN